MRRPVANPDEVVSNIRNFPRELAANTGMQTKLGHTHAWYALKATDGGWQFGPSKFVGYPGNTAQKYLESYRITADGRETEKVLAKWFPPIDLDSRLGKELFAALERFLSEWGRRPREGVRISVVPVEGERDARLVRAGAAELNRITSDPSICGGRPCIRGTRMRVSDVIDMLAAGANHTEILQDYPYLSEEDIAAALAYAARATDHRVIQAA